MPFKKLKPDREINKRIHELPGPMRAILIELPHGPLSKMDMLKCLSDLELRLSSSQKIEKRISRNKTEVEKGVEISLNKGLIKQDGDIYHITDQGRELAGYMEKVIPDFFRAFLSLKTVSYVTIGIHVFLSILKLLFGLLSGSAGLIADGIDNSVDTLSSFFVWIGIKFKKEKIISFIIVFMMFISVIGIVITGIKKIMNPGPVQDDILVFVISMLAGFIMLFLSAYQYIVGKKQVNSAVISQSVDSKNHFYTSLFVCLGILLSLFAIKFDITWLYYGDAVVCLIIAVIIFKGAFELTREFIKSGVEDIQISHFVESKVRRFKNKLLLSWLENRLSAQDYSMEELDEMFNAEFCGQVPKIMLLTGIGYKPGDTSDLHFYINKLLKQGKLKLHNNKYSFIT